MPIHPENRKRYPKDWAAISKRIRFERAKNRCEWCKAPNGKIIARAEGCYMVEDGDVFSDKDGEHLGVARGSEFVADRFVQVVLTCAHLNHVPEDCRDENLAALCQRCHLNYDRHLHAANAKRTRQEKRDSGPQLSFDMGEASK